MPLPTIPGYEILGELGHGGMGVVYQARQVSLDRVVALKMIRSGDLASPQDLIRFQSEAEAVARFKHPNIVQIYEVGDQDGRPYFSLEYVEGGSLAEKVKGIPQPPRAAAELVETLALAVHAAHQRGIVHRDLKPTNILLGGEVMRSRGGEEPTGNAFTTSPSHHLTTPKIADFGLAKRLDFEAGQTQTGAVMGTPSYMAPEQAAGKTKEIGPETDVYSLGAILYELLTGRPPFLAESWEATRQLVLSEEPVAPCRLQPKVPRDLQTICLKCLEKEPQKRYLTARDLADDLGRFLKAEPIRARPVSLWERGWSWAKRRPAVAALLAALAIVLTISLPALTVLWLQAENAKGEQKKATNVAQNRYEDARLRGYIANMNLAQRAWQEGQPLRVLELLDEATSSQPGDRDLRGFEWYYLRRLCPKLQTLKGHTGWVDSVAFSPDGRRIASGSDDETVRVWDADTGKEIYALKVEAGTNPLKDNINVVFSPSVAISPDGRSLASGANDGTVRVWEAATGKQLRLFSGQNPPISSVAFSSDGRLAAAGWHSTPQFSELKVWEVVTGKEILSLTRPRSSSVAFSPDGRRFAWGDGDMLRIWDTTTGKEILSLKGHRALAFSPDGRRLVSERDDGTIKVWDLATGKEMLDLKLKTSREICSGAFSPDGKRLASGDMEGVVKIWEAATGKELLALKQHTGNVTRLAFSPDGQRLASAGIDQTVKVWDVATGDTGDYSFKTPTGGVIEKFSPNGQLLVANDGWTFTVCDLTTGKQLLCLKERTEVASTMTAFSSDGQWLAATPVLERIPTGPKSSRFQPSVTVWEVTTGKEAMRFPGEKGVAFSPDGQWLVSNCPDGPLWRIKVWETATGREILSKSLKMRAPNLAFSPDAHCLAAAGNRILKVWKMATGEEVLSIEGQTFLGINYVAFSPDGRHLATGFLDTVRVWDTTTWEEVYSLRGHDGNVNCLAFSRDSRRVATASDDRTVRVWETTTGKEVLLLRGHTSGVVAVAFSRDGQSLASAGGGGTVRVWEAVPPPAEKLVLREAVSLVNSLIWELVRKDDVLQRIHGDPTLSESVRRAAADEAENYHPDPEQLNVASWIAVSKPNGKVSDYRRALLQAEELCRLVPTEGNLLITLGMAQYRVGDYHKALETLKQAEKMNADYIRRLIADLAFLAMTHHRLGQKEKAHEYLARLREIWKQKQHKHRGDQESEGFILEAETLLQGPAEKPKK